MSFFRKDTRFFWFNLLGSLLILFASGFFYRVFNSKLQRAVAKPVNLKYSLNLFPLKIYGWRGYEIPLPSEIIKITGTDDHLNRFYCNKSKKMWVNFYAAFSGRPRSMLGHRPGVCYPAHGWENGGVKKIEFENRYGKVIPCLLHRFHKPGGRKIFVLNFYIINGKVCSSEEGFSGLGWRTPNIEGDAAQYVCQVQLRSDYENSVIIAAKDLSEELIEFLRNQEDRDGVSRNKLSENQNINQ